MRLFEPAALEALRVALRESPATSATPASGTQCLADDVLAGLADQSLAPDLRTDALRHLAVCGTCRTATVSLARALRDRSVRAELASLGQARGWRRPIRRLVLPAAAAAVLAVLWIGTDAPTEPRHRAPAITAVDIPQPIAPIGAGARADALRWSSVPGADRYRVTLYNAVGQVLYDAEVDDTVAVLPDTVRLHSGRVYFWNVEGRTGWGRWSASHLLEFSIDGERTP